MSDENEIPDNTKRTSPLAAVGIIIVVILLIWRLSHLHDPPPADPMQITNKDIVHMDSLVKEMQRRKQATKTISSHRDSSQ